MTSYRFPFLDLRLINGRLSSELRHAASRVIDSGRYIGGPELDIISDMMCSATGMSFCIPVSNGLDALRLILRSYVALGRISPGHEVVMPANSFIASALAVVDAGLIPVFAEPNPDTLLVDSSSLASFVNDRTAAIMPVDLYGRVWFDPDLLDSVRSAGILVIEDAAQAIGAASSDGHRAGAVGNAAAFSFYPTKNVGALGDAGAVVTDDIDLADMIRCLANYGSDGYGLYQQLGFNCRMDPMQAAMLQVRLKHMSYENGSRRANALVYTSRISNPAVVLPPDEPGMVYHQYVVRVPGRRDEFRQYLSDNGVESAVHYPVPLDRQPAMNRFVTAPLPIAGLLAGEIVSLPVSSATSVDDAVAIADIINSFPN